MSLSKAMIKAIIAKVEATNKLIPEPPNIC